MAKFETTEREFEAYEERFRRLVGEHKPGQYGRYKNRLLLRLDAAAFSARLETYKSLGEQFNATLMNGDTIDDDLFVALKGAEDELLFERSHYLPQVSR
ncbi:MAG: hypothetical protein ACYTF3_02250 [Planctomycetota bacterium]|jgi:hypothetical protein